MFHAGPEKERCHLRTQKPGRLPRGFGVKRLMDLPMAWPDQWSALGLRAPAER
jgi:hypothetical protein